MADPTRDELFPALTSVCENSSFAAPRLLHLPLCTHGLRRGLHSGAASRLKSWTAFHRNNENLVFTQALTCRALSFCRFAADVAYPVSALRILISGVGFGIVFFAFVLLSTTHSSASECIPFSEARHYIGKSQCVTGTIVHVKAGRNGVTFLDFCDDYEVCPFTVVVFASDLRRIGDVMQLKGRSVQIRGKIEEYDGRAEIILSKPKQLGEAASLLPALPDDAALRLTLPADYDVERRGHYSPGKIKHAKKSKTASTRKQGAPVPVDDPSQKP